MKLGLLFAIAPLSVTACPGSASKLHAKCEMDVKFSNSCDEVRAEIVGRMQSPTWTDPHNGGTYTLISSNASYVSGQRLTGDKKYTDKFDFLFSASGTGCKVDACSESQVSSIVDYSTNYCNLHDLYCSSSDGCPTVGKDLSYTETYSSCSQHDDVCVVSHLRAKKLTEECSTDVQNAALDITQAGIAIANSVTDCADGYTAKCDEDIDKILSALTKAADDITQAVYDCGGTEPTACSNDVNAIIADITSATIEITDAVVHCGNNPTLCKLDITAATKDLVEAAQDIAKAVTDCSA